MSYLKNKYPREGQPYVCRKCGRRVLDIRVFKNHIESAHIVTRGFPCKYCDRVSKTRQALSQHIYRNHTSARKGLRKHSPEKRSEASNYDEDDNMISVQPDIKHVVDMTIDNTQITTDSSSSNPSSMTATSQQTALSPFNIVSIEQNL